MLINSHTFQYRQKVCIPHAHTHTHTHIHTHAQTHEHKNTLDLGPPIYQYPKELLVRILTTKGQPQPVTNVAMFTKQSSTHTTKAWIHWPMPQLYCCEPSQKWQYSVSLPVTYLYKSVCIPLVDVGCIPVEGIGFQCLLIITSKDTMLPEGMWSYLFCAALL